jgi:hypothetical protein
VKLSARGGTPVLPRALLTTVTLTITSVLAVLGVAPGRAPASATSLAPLARAHLARAGELAGMSPRRTGESGPRRGAGAFRTIGLTVAGCQRLSAEGDATGAGRRGAGSNLGSRMASPFLSWAVLSSRGFVGCAVRPDVHKVFSHGGYWPWSGRLARPRAPPSATTSR